jgi:hypothetical protein
MSPPREDSPDMRQEERDRWARETLRIPLETPEKEVHALLLDRLEEADFVPSPDWSQAIRQLAGAAPRRVLRPSTYDAFLAHDEERLRDEVDAFAARFFDSPPSERRQRWAGLLARCEWSAPLEARLRWLEVGLDVVWPKCNFPSDDVRLLIEHVGEAFVLSPGHRDALHRDFWRKIAKKGSVSSVWRHVVHLVRKSYSDVARLDPEFLDALARGSRAGGLLFWDAKASKTPRAAPEPVAGGGRSGGTFPWWIGIILAMSLARACPNSERSPPQPTPRFNPSPTINVDWSKMDRGQAEAVKRILSPPEQPRPSPDLRKAAELVQEVLDQRRSREKLGKQGSFTRDTPPLPPLSDPSAAKPPPSQKVPDSSTAPPKSKGPPR